MQRPGGAGECGRDFRRLRGMKGFQARVATTITRAMAGVKSKIFTNPLPKAIRHGHNSRPNTGNASTGSRGNEKNLSRGVDVPGNPCIMCGSLGHFGDKQGSKLQEGRGAEAGSRIFDSVRR